MTKRPGWAQWEADLQEVLGLDATICSGNQFNDIGDATDSARDATFPLLVDCKYTEKLSFPVARKAMEQWLLRGVERGKRAIVAVRVWPRGMPHGRDYVVCSLDDFAELYEMAKIGIEEVQRTIVDSHGGPEGHEQYLATGEIPGFRD